jgi:endonuclease-3
MNTGTALLRAEAVKIKKAKEAKKKKTLNVMAKELAKRSVDKDI